MYGSLGKKIGINFKKLKIPTIHLLYKAEKPSIHSSVTLSCLLFLLRLTSHLIYMIGLVSSFLKCASWIPKSCSQYSHKHLTSHSDCHFHSQGELIWGLFNLKYSFSWLISFFMPESIVATIIMILQHHKSQTVMVNSFNTLVFFPGKVALDPHPRFKRPWSLRTC